MSSRGVAGVPRLKWMALGLCVWLGALAAHANPALSWLASQQGPEGSYGHTPTSLATPAQSTAEVLRAQLALGQGSGAGFDSALGFLNTRSAADTELLAHQVLVNAELGLAAPLSVGPLLAQLATHQHEEGGFGASPGFAPSVFDTALALEALAAANLLASPQAEGAVAFLLSRQQASGAWADGANEPSVPLTALSMRALWACRSAFADVAPALTRAQGFLLSRRNAEGLWGEDFEGALALLALVPHVGDLSLVDASATALQARQRPDGSWAADAYTTALALRALKAYDARKSGSPPAASGSISGYVVRANSTEPISGASVTVEQLPGLAVLTNGEGYYVLPGLPAGSYTVTASKAGYTSASGVVSVQANGVSLAGDLVLDLASQTGLVRGLVFDAATRQPLGAVQVSLTGATTASVLTNSAGEFDFGPVAPGDYSLRFEKSGYLTLTGTVTVEAGRTLSTQLGMTLAGGYVDDTPGTVSGRVVDGKSGQPLAGAVFDLGGGLSATSGADGTFRLASVPRSTYTGSLSATGYQSATFGLVFSPGASGDVGTLSLFLQAVTPPPSSLTLRGLVADGVSGAAIPGASVVLVETGESVTAGADGRFVLSGITLQGFHLAVSASGYAPATYTLQVSAYGEAEVTLRLSPPGNGATSSQLAGVVTDAATGAALAGAQVFVVGTALSTVTASNGGFTLAGIDSLEFVVQVSAVGYAQQSLSVKLAAHGSYPLHPKLQPVAGESFQVVAVAARQAEYGAGTTALFTARIASLLGASKAALVLGEIQDATGTSVATVRPYAEGTTTPASEFVFGAGELKELTVPWDTAQFPPGTYRLVVRVSEPGTLSRGAPFGEVLAENAAHTRLVSTLAVEGALDINPPLTQAGLPTPVSFSARVRNAGNTPLPAGPYVLTVSSATSGAPLFTAEAHAEALEVGVHTVVAFGTWVPSEPGNLPVRVRAKDASIAGELTGSLYVGDKASGTFTVSRTVVPEGTHTVRGTIHMQGVDTSQGGSTDPLYALVREAVGRGGVYTAREGVAWHERNRCLGCHIQTQSLLGLSSSLEKAPIDAKATRFLYNAIASSPWADGSVRIAHPEFSKTQTALGLWSLSAWADVAGSFRVKYRGARYLQANKVRGADKTHWVPDHVSGWWNTNVGQTALVVKGYVDVLQSAARLPEAGVPDYTLGEGRSLGSGSRTEGMAVGPDGLLYMAKFTTGLIHRMDLSTGQVSTFATGLGSSLLGLAFGPDGSLYVSRNATTHAVTRIRPDGTRSTYAVGGNLTDAAFGADGWLYLSDWTGQRILRLNPASGAVETYVSGGLLNRPHGLAFDAEGNLLVANQNGYNILKVAAADQAVSKFADGLAYPPTRMTRAADGSLYITTFGNEGLLRVHPDGSAERVLQSPLNLQGVVAHAGRVYVANDSGSTLHELLVSPLDTSGLSELADELPYAVRYLLTNTEHDTDNIVHALRLIGLAEARAVLTDSALLAQVDAKVASEATLLRSRQRPTGGWSRYTYITPSDPLATAMVGLALEYTNPSRTDPQIRNAIQYLLNTQRPDGSWDNFSNGLGTRLASTSFVMVFLPKALDRLGGIDIDLHLELPGAIQLSNPSMAPSSSQPGADGAVAYLWKLPGVTGTGREVAFDLGLLDMALGESRPVATRAWLEFKNSFVDGTVRLPLDIPVVSVTSGMTLTVATDKAHYLADEPVAISAGVTNTGQAPASGQVVLALRAVGSSEPVAVLPPLPFTELAAGAQLPLGATWNTGSTLAGDYEVHARLLDAQGRVLAEAVAPFDIRAPAALASTAIATDRPVYDAWSVVGLTGHVSNVATNAALPPSRAELTVRTPTGETLYFTTRDVTQLAPGGVVTLPDTLRLADAASGTYPVTLVLKDAFTRDVLSTSTTHFQVVRRAIQGLTGTVTVRSPIVHQGEPNACTDRTQVAGGSVPGVTLTHRLIRVDSEALLEEASETVDLSAGGPENVYTRDISTAGLELGGYACVLQAQVDGESRTLAAAGFRVIEPPIKVSAQLALGGRGRLLVLLDPASLGDDPHGPEVAPELSPQRAFLEELLTQAGWSYTLTESAEDFTRELRTGGYAVYALLSEQEKLSEQAQRELREAVFRGEGLVVAGAHDARNHGQDAALGVKFLGRLSQADAVVLSSVGFPLLNGELSVLTDERPERIERTGAESLAYYRQAGTRGPDALTLHTYGKGEAAFAGVDLLAIATRDGLASLPAEVLRLLLLRVHPVDLPSGPGAVVPVQLTVTNEGIAVPVSATVTLPAGLSVIDPGPGVVSGQAVTFSFPLAVDEVKTVRFWVRLPDTPGTFTLQAVVQAGDGSQTVSVTAEVVLSVAPVETLASIQAQLDDLVRDGHPDAQALRQASHFLGKALQQEDPSLARPGVLQATDVLVGLEDPRVMVLRVALGIWLRGSALGTS